MQIYLSIKYVNDLSDCEIKKFQFSFHKNLSSNELIAGCDCILITFDEISFKLNLDKVHFK